MTDVTKGGETVFPGVRKLPHQTAIHLMIDTGLSVTGCACYVYVLPQMYLTDVERGGETVVPGVPRLPHQTAENGWTECGMQASPFNGLAGSMH